ncbi:MAG: RtcB family protein [Acidimicrobiia bacterium]
MDRLKIWGTEIDDATVAQSRRAASLPIVHSHVALMPDAHVGIGATVGSVIPTLGAIIPAAVGVDLGCGMAAIELDLVASQLPDSLDPLLSRIERAVPAGVGKGHAHRTERADSWFAAHRPATELAGALVNTAHKQFGSLGSGNHFFEVCLDERESVWIVLHSGSRGVGNKLANKHMGTANKLAASTFTELDDPDLAYFLEGTPEFDAYVADMLWAQDYARGNRDAMLSAALGEVLDFVGFGTEVSRVNCHHNFAQREHHGGCDVWVTRKGAIQADAGRLGVIPGSMGTRSYIVRGLGNAESWNSCSHGASRRLSRTAARKQFTASDLAEQMGDRVWLKDRARSLVDEIPSAYKDIDQVMADQRDLVEVVHVLHQVLNYKGT